jgi:hypothetical protein
MAHSALLSCRRQRLQTSNPMELQALASALAALGCPPDRVNAMAAQLDRRARQLAEQKGRSYEDALAHLLGLMRQGWAAQQRGVRDE